MTDAGYRPQPNAVSLPNEKLADPDYDGPYTYPEVEGDTLAADHYQGAPTPLEAPVREKSRKSSNVSYIPRALDTGNVTIRPNTFVTKIKTDSGGWFGDLEATGVEYRDTWSGETGEIDADVVVMAAGCIETPRLWLNSDLPRKDNGVELDEDTEDEHGPVADVTWNPHPDDDAKRDELAEKAAELLQAAGANHVHRADAPPLLLHMQSSMWMGEVVDENCEAYDVDRLFVGDHSAMAKGLGGPNPTNTGQALALRTADKIDELYF